MKNISWSHRVSWQLLNLVPVDAGAGLGDELVEERAEAVQVRHPPPPVQYSTIQYGTVQYITVHYSTVQYSHLSSSGTVMRRLPSSATMALRASWLVAARNSESGGSW